MFQFTLLYKLKGANSFIILFGLCLHNRDLHNMIIFTVYGITWVICTYSNILL
jgi:hypothetical protein